MDQTQLQTLLDKLNHTGAVFISDEAAEQYNSNLTSQLKVYTDKQISTLRNTVLELINSPRDLPDSTMTSDLRELPNNTVTIQLYKQRDLKAMDQTQLQTLLDKLNHTGAVFISNEAADQYRRRLTSQLEEYTNKQIGTLRNTVLELINGPRDLFENTIIL